MTKYNLQKNKGFVILFAVTLSSIILAIALGVANIALKEIKFGTSANGTNDAFFAADTGIEHVLLADKTSDVTYVCTLSSTVKFCNKTSTFIGLGGTGSSCANVSFTKDNTSGVSTITTIISKGYNIGDSSCLSSNSDRIERELEISY